MEVRDSTLETPVYPNNWQKIQELTHDIVTPGNGISVVGLGLAVYGLPRLNTWHGIGAACGGFMADNLDGWVARKTGTTSKLGEVIDAAGDKVKLALGAYSLWKHDLAPKQLITAISVQNGFNAAVTLADRAINDEPALHSSKAGKIAFFAQEWGLGLHVIGSQIAKSNESNGKNIKRAGTVLAIAGLAIGIKASFGYARTFLESRSSDIAEVTELPGQPPDLAPIA